MKRRAPGRVAVTALLLLVSLYFEVYKHFWVWDLVGLEVNHRVNLPMLVLLAGLAVVYHGTHHWPTPSWLRTGTGEQFAGALVLFACGSMVSVGINEPGLDEVATYLFYLLTPMLVLVSVVVLHPTDHHICRTLAILFLGALACAAYSTVLHIRLWSGEDLTAVYELYRVSNLDPDYVARESVPGLGGNSLPSMLVPMVLAGLYFAQRHGGRLKIAAIGATSFLFFSMLISASRGAAISLAVGLLYLAMRHWFRFNFKLVLVAALAVTVFATYGDLVVSRFARSVLVQEAEEGIEGYERLASMRDSLSFYFAPNPIVGAGFTYFNESQGARIFNTDHNLYTMLLAQGGLLVVVPFLLILFVIYRNAARMLRKCRDDRATVDLGMILVAGLVAFMVDLNFPPGFFHYYAIWWGLVAAWGRNAQMHGLARPDQRAYGRAAGAVVRINCVQARRATVERHT